MPTADHSIEPARGAKTLCIPGSPQPYERIVDDPLLFRASLGRPIEATPELFPPEIRQGYRMKDIDTSRETDGKRRRIDLRNDQSDLIHPSFLMPYLCGRTEDAHAPPFLRTFAVLVQAAQIVSDVGRPLDRLGINGIARGIDPAQHHQVAHAAREGEECCHLWVKLLHLS